VEFEKAPNELLYVPGGHSVALIDDVDGQNEPRGHRTGSDSPVVGQIAPEGHARQVAFDDAPTELLYVAAGQPVGLTDAHGQNEPVGQSSGAPDAQKNDAGQVTHVSCRIRLLFLSVVKRIPEGDRARNIGPLKRASEPKPSAKEAEPLPAIVFT
jgi:hypothetical protein